MGRNVYLRISGVFMNNSHIDFKFQTLRLVLYVTIPAILIWWVWDADIHFYFGLWCTGITLLFPLTWVETERKAIIKYYGENGYSTWLKSLVKYWISDDDKESKF